MSHIFFFYSSVIQHIGCFHVVAIVSNAGVSIGVNMFFSNYGFLWVYAQRASLVKQNGKESVDSYCEKLPFLATF